MTFDRGRANPPPDFPFTSASSAESFGRARFRLCGLFCAAPRRCSGFERAQKPARDSGYFIDGGKKRRFIYLRRFVKAADFSDELKRSRANLFRSDRRIEVEKNFDIPAHSPLPQGLVSHARATPPHAPAATRFASSAAEGGVTLYSFSEFAHRILRRTDSSQSDRPP